MFETIFTGNMTPSDLSINAFSFLICMVLALAMGGLVCVSYLLSTPKRGRSASFILSLIILPALVAIVIILIGGNLARAFTTAGIFTLVRFRSIPGDSRDLSYVFLTTAIGLSLGLGYLTISVIVTIIICTIIVLVNKLTSNRMKQKEKKLRITVPEDMNYEGVFEEVLKKYTDYYEMNKVKTVNMGTMLDLYYDIMLKKGMSEKEFIDELRCRNGNLTIQLGISENAPQQL